MWKHVLSKGLGLAILAATLLVASGAQAACIRWSDARDVIAKNRLLKPGVVRSRTIKRGNEVISINLCRSGGRYVYRMTVIGKKKRARDIVVDARSGKTVGGRKGARGSSDERLKNRIINRVKRNLRRHGINYY